MTQLVLLSGAGLPEWIWGEVRRVLPFESLVVAYPKGSASLRAYAESALTQSPQRFTLIAHSVGGVVGTEMCALAPDRVEGFVGLSACLPPAGRSFVQTMPLPQRAILGFLLRLLGTRPPDKQIRQGLCAGVSDDVAARLVADFAPESRALFTDAVSARSFPARSAYFVTEHDREFPAALQRRFAAELGGNVETLPTAHLPMLEDPDETAKRILGALA
jgi:pimeloyl-ACP methyl ester carboxylesterase